MRLLLDTCAFVWLAAGDPALGAEAAQRITAEGAQVHLSAASVWEMAIKASLGKLILHEPLLALVAEATRRGVVLLPIEAEHAAGVELLPFHHRDPFDRLLVAQALEEGLTVATPDPAFAEYGVHVVWD